MATLKDGWIYTGDLGHQDADGYVYLVGRKKHMIIRGGENVYPSEVEPTLLKAPGVRDAVVLGLPDETWGEIVVAAVTRDGNDAEAEAIIAHCKHHLASYRCPERIYFVDEMPLNAAGEDFSGTCCWTKSQGSGNRTRDGTLAWQEDSHYLRVRAESLKDLNHVAP